MNGLSVDDVIQCAAELVDCPTDVGDEYRRGVVELATLLCFPASTPEARAVMGYAVYGVNRPSGVSG